MGQETTKFVLTTTDGAMEFMEIFSEYIDTHNVNLQTIVTVTGDEEDITDFKEFYGEENGLYENEDGDIDDVIYPNGRYM